MKVLKTLMGITLIISLLITVQLLVKSAVQKNLITTQHELIEKQRFYIQELKDENAYQEEQYHKLIRSFEFISLVDVTMYNPVEGQTDDTPLITASNRKINPEFASQHKWIAVSRDLHKRYGGHLKFGDRVYVSGTEGYDGIYTVHDLMNARFIKRIDILRTEGSPIFKYEEAVLYRIFQIEINTGTEYIADMYTSSSTLNTKNTR